jgi:hypothetical protein
MLQIFLSDRLVHRHSGVHRIACTSTKLFLSRVADLPRTTLPVPIQAEMFPYCPFCFICFVLNPS